MFKIVDGKQVELSEREIGDIKEDEEKFKEYVSKISDEINSESASRIRILKASGLSDEAIGILQPSLKKHLG